jgi:hypothetical protein
MIWFTWRQFRTQTWITVGALAGLSVALIITGLTIADAYDAANIAGCGSDCAAAITNFLTQVKTGISGTVYELANAIMYVVPAVIGIFWGAPLLARELETGTHRLAWNQSVTRTRWLGTKLAVIAAVSAATVGLLSWAVTTWAHRIDAAAGDRITPLVYGARGIVPMGYALFAFILGVTAGMLIRRTVPAMATTLAIYSVAVFSMQEWVRQQLVAASNIINPLDTSSLDGVSINPDTGEMTVFASANLPDAWVLTNQTITDTGQAFTGPFDPQYCGPDAGFTVCEEWIATLGLRQDLTYHPASNFWPLQWTEAGILTATAVLLTGFCFWWTRRRLT